MTYRSGVCVIVYKNNKFLIFHRIQNWRGWEFLKGGIRKGETERKCLLRELREETGNTKFKIIKTPYFFKYKWKKSYIKDNMKFTGMKQRLYLAKFIGNKKVKVDKTEHDKFKWATKREVLKLITHNNHKKAFKYVLKNYFK
ncbi:MAG: NUDIX domain-containing protein [Candidatus Aenigmatarchaeota archaeon]